MSPLGNMGGKLKDTGRVSKIINTEDQALAVVAVAVAIVMSMSVVELPSVEMLAFNYLKLFTSSGEILFPVNSFEIFQHSEDQEVLLW